jgi:hypothetical protein
MLFRSEEARHNRTMKMRHCTRHGRKVRVLVTQNIAVNKSTERYPPRAPIYTPLWQGARTPTTFSAQN